ncbi:MAG: type II secretion system protein [Epsilonproteobacteria bacterium]|nr:hypothetical protein [Campylobacterota bacterium]NPA57643.1 type II secretion system protein [Campylobacterota bacterium]
MKRGFTLIEVITAVVILALLGVALLKNGGDTLSFMEKIEKKERVNDYLTIIALHRDPDYNHLTKGLEDFLKINVLDDDLRQILKEKFTYQEREVKVKMPMLDDFNQTLEGGEGDLDEEMAPENPIAVSFVKLTIHSDKKGGGFIYLLELNE